MANVKITELTALTDPASTDVLPIVDVVADVTKKISIADLLENAGSGTAAAPGIAFDGDSNTGIYRPGADQLAISTNGSQALLIDASGNVTAAGTSTAGSFIPTSSTVPTNGVYLPSANNVALATNGAQALYINADGDILVADGNRMEIDEIRARDGAGLKLFDDAGAGIFVQDGGNVGVGTSSPDALLQIGELDVSGSARGGIAVKTRTSIGTFSESAIYIEESSGSEGFYIGVNSDGGLFFSNSGTTTPLFIGDDDRVGIGTAGPVTKFHVEDDTNSTTPGSTSLARIESTGAGTDAGIRFKSGTSTYTQIGGIGGSLYAYTGGNERARIDSAGRLLVGTSSFTGEASAVLEGSSAGGTTQAQLWLNRGQTDPVIDNVLGQIIFGDATASGSNGAMIQARADSNWGGANGNPTRLAFFTEQLGSDSGSKERMRILSDGRIVYGFGSGTQLVLDAVGANDFAGATKTSLRSSPAFAIRSGNTGGVELANGATSWASFSQLSLKTDLTPIANGLDKTASLSAFTGRYKTDDEGVSRSFLIADEVQTVLPEAVSGTGADDDPLILRYTEVIPLLVAALKESKERIETLEAKVAALEAA